MCAHVCMLHLCVCHIGDTLQNSWNCTAESLKCNSPLLRQHAENAKHFFPSISSPAQISYPASFPFLASQNPQNHRVREDDALFVMPPKQTSKSRQQQEEVGMYIVVYSLYERGIEAIPRSAQEILGLPHVRHALALE